MRSRLGHETTGLNYYCVCVVCLGRVPDECYRRLASTERQWKLKFQNLE